jgi:transcription termination/antitermination protein NusG
VPQTKGGEALPSDEWYAVWTRSNCEHLVMEQLAAKAFTSFLPEMAVRARRDGKVGVVRLPIFPGYLFVRGAMDKSSYLEILKARGVVRILDGGWSRLTPIPVDEVDAIQRLVHSGVPLFPHAYFHEGDRVRVVEGPLVGIEGLFVREQPNKGRLVLSINLLQASVAVEVDATSVDACQPRHGMSGACGA